MLLRKLIVTCCLLSSSSVFAFESVGDPFYPEKVPGYAANASPKPSGYHNSPIFVERYGFELGARQRAFSACREPGTEALLQANRESSQWALKAVSGRLYAQAHQAFLMGEATGQPRADVDCGCIAKEIQSNYQANLSVFRAREIPNINRLAW